MISHISYTRRLPHLQLVGAAFFMTWRLHGSLPEVVVQRAQAELEEQIVIVKRRKLPVEEENRLINHHQGMYFLKLDDYLDKVKEGPHYLKNSDAAMQLIAKIKQYDGVHYRLEACCVMSNHVHALMDFGIQLPEYESDFDESKYVQLETVMKLIKGGSSFEINKILGRNGTLWSDVNFDRYIRNENHYNNVVNYILNNPIKAGLCTTWEDYPFTYLRPII
jgi:putative transposase